MSNNCLVTQLKENVQNDELLKVGELRFSFSVKRNDSLTIETYNNPVVVKVLDGTFTGDVDEVIIPANAIDTLNYVDASKFSIIRKYDLRTFTLNSNVPTDITVSDLFYSKKLTSIRFRTDKPFTIQDLNAMPKLISILLINCANLTGATSDFLTHPNKDYIESISINESKITGSLDDFLNLLSIRTISINYCNIEVKRSTLNALAARNVTVNYTQTPIEDV